MTPLQQELEKMGLSTLSFSEQEQTLLEQFISISSPFFDNVCQHRADKPAQDLVLGLLTKSHREAFDEYQATQPKIKELKQLFSEQVGSEHAGKFTTLNQAEVTVISSLWFMAQGYTGIDFSYANDHAQETAELLCTNLQSTAVDDEIQHIRTRFMQAYYTGVEHSQNSHSSGSYFKSIKTVLKRFFGR
ncbi:hypothetical protein MD588_15675 [Photobacterium sp. SDRW27]|uniref:hypothetical protein n=1 Tax=Photobacterium obscurum TaxID=2829490 RepID=UPI0022431103|nr:hypothetical protein [Photobacterium obscurum]MCW8330250.1 hypothetical protein [Photobacterium obscurum]